MVDEAVSWAPALAAAERRAFALVVLALEEARAAGSTRLRLDGVAGALTRLAVDEPHRREAARLAGHLASEPALAALVGGPDAYKPFVVDDGCLYAHRDWRLEDRLARALAARLAAPAFALALGAVDAAIAQAALPGRAFNAEQVAALGAALTRPLTLVTGGPGTGKTALLAGLVRALRHLGLGADEIVLAAPTGRAANRIAESLGALATGASAPRTLHRLLGFRGGRASARAGELRHHENYPLPARAVLVDEASMIDLGLMERLVRAVRPDARLVLLGDADQLPSVDAGAVFRDLAPRAARLTVSHRQDPSAPAGGAVRAGRRARRPRRRRRRARRRAARAPRRPHVVGLPSCSRPRPVGPAAERRLVAAFADHWLRERVRAPADYGALTARVYRLGNEAQVAGGAPFDADDTAALLRLARHHQSLRVLAVTRDAGATTSAESLNQLLARKADAASGLAPDPTSLAPGTPVLVIRNDYDRGLFNGDQGVVVAATRADARRALVAVFPRGAGLAAFPFEGLRDELRVAYATTVHKAQGAELDHVALVLPARDLPLLSRELVYTALTRARQSAVVVGRPDLLARAVARPLERASGLAARLDALLAPGA